uniref:Homeobox domain-containing protein n=1 Tax=Neogobius melanostomus TaxID=47308 RepID=A0A8C6WN80_9GOBI
FGVGGQGDPPSSQIQAMDIPAGALHSFPLSLASFSPQFLSPYVLSLSPSLVGDKIQVFSNPPSITRKHEFEQISEWVQLPKKVVQIWFQNMRARERKGEVRFISDGTLAAVGKPLIKFTWPLAKPIFSNKPPTPNNTGGIAASEVIGTELNLPVKVVQIWFQNTRAKEKRWKLQQENMVRLNANPVFYSCFSSTV